MDVSSGLDSVSSMEMLTVLRGLCNNGHLVIITTQALPEKSAELFNQLVLLSDKQVSEKGTLGPVHTLTSNNFKTEKFWYKGNGAYSPLPGVQSLSFISLRRFFTPYISEM